LRKTITKLKSFYKISKSSGWLDHWAKMWDFSSIRWSLGKSVSCWAL